MSGISSGAVMGIAFATFVIGFCLGALFREAANETISHEPQTVGADEGDRASVPGGPDGLVDPHSRKAPPRVWLNAGGMYVGYEQNEDALFARLAGVDRETIERALA